MKEIDHCDEKRHKRHCKNCGIKEYYRTEGNIYGWWPVPFISEEQKQKDLVREVLKEST
jgi:hypothetical protein